MSSFSFARGSARSMLAALAAMTLVATLSGPVRAQDTGWGAGSSGGNDSAVAPGPVRLRQPARINEAPAARDERQELDPNDPMAGDRRQPSDGSATTPMRPGTRMPPYLPYVPGEFEQFVQRLVDQTPAAKAVPQEARQRIRRFGAELMTQTGGTPAADYLPQVPADYLLSPGDEVLLTLWGSVDADLRLPVDRAGRINIPRVGSVMVAGVRYADLPAVIQARVAQVFRNFQLSVSLTQLRAIRVYVTGFTPRPGSYTVSALSTVVGALIRAGGPSAAGSFRDIELRRQGRTLARFDLYDLLLKGDRSGDLPLQAEDVVHVNAVGRQVALIGSVNKPAIFELKQGDTVQDVIRMAGGLTAVADRSRLGVEQLDQRGDSRIIEIRLPQAAGATPASGDVLRAFSLVETTPSAERQNKRVRVEGEVARPGDYIMPAKSTIADAIAVAGGLTPMAYLFGTEFERESVRITQQQNYERALRDLETEFVRVTTTQRAINADEAAVQQSRQASATRLVERLRAVRPTGRIVLQMNPAAPALPALALEDGDRLYVPTRPTTVGVFGSVFNAGSYLYSDQRRVEDYLHVAGGPTRGADTKSMFVLRANGSVVSAVQRSSGWFGIGSGIDNVPAEPGDTIFVPEELNKTSFVQEMKEWTQILYQFGLGAAALQTLKN